ncbi:MAG: hypothetical protein ABWW66_06150 [Archaeoglobaceae archaeon]
MIDVPERVLYEAEVYEIDDDLRVKKGIVKITESRMIFNSDEGMRLLMLDDVRMLKLVKDEKLGYLISAASMLATAIFAFAFGFLHGIDNYSSALAFFVAPLGLTLTSAFLFYWWLNTRSWVLSFVTDYGKEVRIRCPDVGELLEIANAVELIKFGAVRKLQKRL